MILFFTGVADGVATVPISFTVLASGGIRYVGTSTIIILFSLTATGDMITPVATYYVVVTGRDVSIYVSDTPPNGAAEYAALENGGEAQYRVHKEGRIIP